jgi:competence protein ComEC
MLQRVPILRLLVPFAIGIACAIALPWYKLIAFAGAMVCGIALLISLLKQLSTHHWLRYAAVASFALAAGTMVVTLQHKVNSTKHYSRHVHDTCAYELEILEPFVTKTSSYKTTARVHRILPSQAAVLGEVLVYFTKDSSAPQLKPGERVVMRAHFLPIKNSGNPNEFDYAGYCNRKGISHAVFADTSSYTRLIGKHSTSLRARFAQWRMHVLAQLGKYIKEPASRGIAEALLVGDKKDVDKETWEAYSKVGVVHIIAISGMHISGIYNFLLLLFGKLLPKKFQRKKSIAIIAAMLGMWIFALLTGLPASIMRACVMYTFIGIGALLGRGKDTFNMLCISALLLLAYEPYWLIDPGFILSYAALLGILLFGRRWSSITADKHWLLHWFWTMIATTTAAQIFTLPFCIYYFAQFPLLFLLSNLIAIPLSGVILALTIAIVLLSVVPVIAAFLGTIATWLITFLNHIIFWMSGLSFFTANNLYMNNLQLCLLLIAITLLCYGVLRRRGTVLLLSLFCVLVFSSSFSWRIVQQHKQKQIVVYNINRQTAIDLIEGREIFSVRSETDEATDK